MADEQITETTDTTTSTTETTTSADDQQVEQKTDDTQVEDVTDPSDDSSVLGGKTADEDGQPDDTADDEAATGAPEKYELTLTDEEGNAVDLDADMLGEAEALFREANLTNDQANGLLKLGPQLMEKGQQAAIEQIIEAGNTQRKEWLEEFKSDETVGGANRKETEELAAKGLDALGFKEGHPFRALLTETGFGNNVHMITAMRRVGELVGEDGTFAHPSTVGDSNTVGWSDRYKD